LAPAERVFAPDQCWALRRGQIYAVPDTGSGLVCRHVHPPLPIDTLCVPMMAQGETLGILHLRSLPGSPALPDEERAATLASRQRLAVALAERIGLAMMNLRLRETLSNQAIRDPLTGLFNRRYMEETLERELRRAARRGAGLGVVMLDLDHFKEINDTYGHGAGDAALRELGAFLRTHIRVEDIACRYGGEEFILILPEAAPSDVLKRAEQLRLGLKQLGVEYRGQSLRALSVSLGVAHFPEHGSTVETIVQAADAALHRAKHAGRDQIVSATIQPES
jgi:diguanylate cyclase (GGDEF)-like protein